MSKTILCTAIATAGILLGNVAVAGNNPAVTVLTNPATTVVKPNSNGEAGLGNGQSILLTLAPGGRVLFSIQDDG